MNKIYGYKEQDVIALAEFIKDRGNKSLSQTFREFAELHGKAQGTVRNLYYALAKLSKEDEGFCLKYLNGKPLSVSKIEGFTEEEEKDLVKKVLIGRGDGVSARGVIMSLSNGDGKIALRLQNKFRNAIKNKPRLVAEVVKELKDEGKTVGATNEKESSLDLISERQMLKLKREINGLVGRIAIKVRRENEYLKERVNCLERENLRLSTLLYGEGKRVGAMRFFKAREDDSALN